VSMVRRRHPDLLLITWVALAFACLGYWLACYGPP